MNIHDAARRYKVSLAKLRRMEADKIIRLDKEDENTAKARFYLSRRQPLTVALLVAMIEEPSLLDDLGRYADRAREQIEALGDVKGGAAPIQVYAYVRGAASGDAEAASVLARWLIDVLPALPVSHYWIATRLLIGQASHLREEDMRTINLALLHTRKLPEFAPYWSARTVNKKSAIFYRHPIKTLDL